MSLWTPLESGVPLGLMGTRGLWLLPATDLSHLLSLGSHRGLPLPCLGSWAQMPRGLLQWRVSELGVPLGGAGMRAGVLAPVTVL